MKWLQPSDICVVTGGKSGLGAEILKQFAMYGCQTVCLDINLPHPAHEDNEVADKTTEDNAEDVAENRMKEGTEQEAEEPSDEVAYTSEDQHTELKRICASSPLDPVPESVATTDDQTTDNANTEKVANRQEHAMPDLSPTLSIECDVRYAKDLERARDLIFEKFNRHPTVVVLNAGIRMPLNSVVDSTVEDLQDTIDINLGGVLRGLHVFLPQLIATERGFVVSIASALGFLVPKGLAAYGASKAGIIGLHEALEQEIAPYKDVHAMLVCPGQLNTTMFSDVKTPSDFFAPIVQPSQLAEKIVKRVRKAKASVIYAPAYVRYLPLIQWMPTPLARLVRKVSGVDNVYDEIAKSRADQSQYQNDEQSGDGLNDQAVDQTNKSQSPAELDKHQPVSGSAIGNSESSEILHMLQPAKVSEAQVASVYVSAVAPSTPETKAPARLSVSPDSPIKYKAGQGSD